MLRVGINARSLADPRPRGFGRHVRSLLKALRALPEPPELHLFSDVPLILPPELADLRTHVLGARPHLAWEHVALPALCARAGIQVFHSPTNIGVPWLAPGVARVVTIHDLITVRDLADPFERLGWRHLKARASFAVSWAAARSAEVLITVSRHTCEDLSRAHPELRSRVHVIPNGVDERFSPGIADAAVLARHGLRAPYFLYVGGFEERKNVGTLVDAFLGCEAPDAILALAGDAQAAPESLRFATAGSPRIRWLGYVPDAELTELYRGATCAVLPSLAEGFGFPVVEAFACGTPVFCSDASSLPEVAGEAAAYFPAQDARVLGGLLARAVRDPAWLDYFRQKGLERAQQFTWEHAAQLTLQAYHDAARFKK